MKGFILLHEAFAIQLLFFQATEIKDLDKQSPGWSDLHLVPERILPS